MMESRLPFRGKEVKQMWKRVHRDQGGFTLIELLVTISILAVLFGIVSLSLRNVGTSATTNVKAAEKTIVESAIDIYFADVPTNTITARDVGACAIITGGGSEFAEYLRRDTEYSYYWTADGVVTQCIP